MENKLENKNKIEYFDLDESNNTDGTIQTYNSILNETIISRHPFQEICSSQ